MKILFILFLGLLAQVGIGQVLLNTSEITSKSDAGEGDLYKNSDNNEYYIGTTEGTLKRIGPQELTYNPATDELEISGGNKIDISSNAYVSICEFIRGEAVIEQKGRILFTIHEDLDTYKTSTLTVSILELSASSSVDNVIVKAEIVRGSNIITINDQVSFNSGTTYTQTSEGNDEVVLQTGDIIRLDIVQTPTNLSDAPIGLTATLKLLK